MGYHPWRVEAEIIVLDGYTIVPVTSFEAASNYTAIITSSNTSAGTAVTKVEFADETYDLAVNYFDVVGGKAKWQLFSNNKEVGGNGLEIMRISLAMRFLQILTVILRVE